MSKVKLTRNELYDLMWSEPITSISKKYVISNDGLKKISGEMQIPCPEPGYWMKLQFSKKVKKVMLPEPYIGKSEVEFEIREEGKDYGSGIFTEKKSVEVEIKELLSSKLKISERLNTNEPLFIAAKQSFAAKHKTYQFIGLIQTLRGEIDIQVSEAFVSRALRFMDYFIKALRVRGHDIQVGSDGTFAFLDGERIRIAFKERCKRVKVSQGKWDVSELHASGRLYFKSDGYFSGEWFEGKTSLEDQVPGIIAKWEVDIRELHKIQQENQIRFQKIRDEEKRVKEIQEGKTRELLRFKNLLAEAERWNQIKNLKLYLQEINAKAIASNMVTEELRNWLDWANERADRYDIRMMRSEGKLEDYNLTTFLFANEL